MLKIAVIWCGKSRRNLEVARSRIKELMLAHSRDYVIFSQETGHKMLVRFEGATEHPCCPPHETYMVPCTDPLGAKSAQGTISFRCPNVDLCHGDI